MATTTSRTLLVTLLGSFARRTDDWMPISAIVSLLGELGADESSIRTSVSRLKKRDWLIPDKRDSKSGYRLSPLARDVLAAGDRVIWHARKPAVLEDGWCIASFSVPETARAKRHLLRSRLAALGFGNAGPGVWIAPARMRGDALAVIDALSLREYTNVFVGRHEGGQHLTQMIRSSWDLDDIHARYRAFVGAHSRDIDGGGLSAEGSGEPRDAFVRFMRAVDDWRALPLRDPGLPRELLRSDWAGDAATELLESIVSRFDALALAFVRDALTR